MTQPVARPTIPGSSGIGPTYTRVVVLSVDGPIAYVRDQTGRQLTVRRDYMRAKGNAPLPGEVWLLDRYLGNQWTFAMCMGASVNGVVIPEGNVTGLTGDLSTLTTGVSGNKSSITSLNTSVSGINSTLAAMQAEQFGAAGRTYKPYVRVQLSAASYGNAANADVFAGANWYSGPDQDGMFTPSNGTSILFSYVTVPFTGRYRMDFSITTDGSEGGSHNAAGHITKNGQVVSSNAIASDKRATIGGPAEGTYIKIYDNRLLTAGDQLFWSTWCSVNTNWLGTSLGVPAYFSVEWMRRT